MRPQTAPEPSPPSSSSESDAGPGVPAASSPAPAAAAPAAAPPAATPPVRHRLHREPLHQGSGVGCGRRPGDHTGMPAATCGAQHAACLHGKICMGVDTRAAAGVWLAGHVQRRGVPGAAAARTAAPPQRTVRCAASTPAAGVSGRAGARAAMGDGSGGGEMAAAPGVAAAAGVLCGNHHRPPMRATGRFGDSQLRTTRRGAVAEATACAIALPSAAATQESAAAAPPPPVLLRRLLGQRPAVAAAAVVVAPFGAKIRRPASMAVRPASGPTRTLRWLMARARPSVALRFPAYISARIGRARWAARP
eukprot:303965-Chlamydomonas_euryale.AAC.3